MYSPFLDEFICLGKDIGGVLRGTCLLNGLLEKFSTSNFETYLFADCYHNGFISLWRRI